MFELDPQLAADTIDLGDLNLCKVLLMNQAQVPWLILVPRHNNIREIFELGENQQRQLWSEVGLISRTVMKLFAGDKLNVGTLGNIVTQLHVHVVVRYQGDPAWPQPVWGNLDTHPYTDEELKLVRENINQALQKSLASLNAH